MPVNDLLSEGDINEDALERFRHSTALAVDTETMGLNPHRDRLCLVQLFDEHDFGHMVRITGSSAPRLKELLENPGSLKVFHYARFDVMFLRHRLGIHIHNVYCTKIASKLARTYAPKHGLKDVIADLLGVELDKSSQSTNWSRPDLTEAQLRYALNDVRYLIPAMKRLNQILEQESRVELLLQSLQVIPTLVDLELLGWNETVFSH